MGLSRRPFTTSQPLAVSLPRLRFDAFHRPIAARSQRLTPRVAALEEAPSAAQGEVMQPAAGTSAVSAEELELEELDEAQEELLSWMLYTDEDKQDEDLAEMVDYDEFGDEEYAELYEEVEKLYSEYDYDFKVGDKVMGTVIDIDDEGAYIEIGAKASGFCPVSECSLAKLKTVRRQ